jgi:hypothetical protein
MKKGFSYYFCMMIEGSGSRSMPHPNGSGSGSDRSRSGFGSATLIRRRPYLVLRFGNDLFQIRIRLFQIIQDPFQKTSHMSNNDIRKAPLPSSYIILQQTLKHFQFYCRSVYIGGRYLPYHHTVRYRSSTFLPTLLPITVYRTRYQTTRYP